jgi:thiol-disulfide isomerase/thioredoxin
MKPFIFASLAAAALHLSPITAQATEKIHVFEPGSFKQIVASEKGKPFVVLVWSLDCEYCQRSFQALAEARKKSGVDVVTIATDRADDPEAAALIRKKLGSSGLGGGIWAFGPAPAEQLRFAIDPKWRGEIPRSYWFDKDGKAVAYSGMITDATVAKLLVK